MSRSDGIRERFLPLPIDGRGFHKPGETGPPVTKQFDTAERGKQLTVSESHHYNRKTGHFDGGGPFFTSRVTPFVKPGYVKDLCPSSSTPSTVVLYDGPVWPLAPSSAKIGEVGAAVKLASRNDPIADLTKDGTTAIALCNPVNPNANLNTTLAETFREGIPSLPGIQSWRARTEILKGLGSEYLNYQFGWAPLLGEVKSVRDAARTHSKILKQYHRDEGSNTRRRFDFPLERSTARGVIESGIPVSLLGTNMSPYLKQPLLQSKSQVSRVTETRKWFEGCFTYALPSSTSSWKKAVGFGSDADKLFGTTLTPEVLWELTPWSWAVDWFTNVGFVLKNVSSFALAGLVMRYGYLMEETRETVTVELDSVAFTRWDGSKVVSQQCGSSSCGYEVVTKKRAPASPFGFGIGWEGLSPTQLAITAALGITRLL